MADNNTKRQITEAKDSLYSTAKSYIKRYSKYFAYVLCVTLPYLIFLNSIGLFLSLIAVLGIAAIEFKEFEYFKSYFNRKEKIANEPIPEYDLYKAKLKKIHDIEYVKELARLRAKEKIDNEESERLITNGKRQEYIW